MLTTVTVTSSTLCVLNNVTITVTDSALCVLNTVTVTITVTATVIDYCLGIVYR